ncbi:MAG TPA: helicase, partial [Cupriavidus sp.]|nr:helicase [Cupriavidus sp.]
MSEPIEDTSLSDGPDAAGAADMPESLANAVAAAAADQAALRSSQLATIFAETGTLASAIPGYRPRAAQEKMSEAVANAIANNDTVIKIGRA